MGQKQNTMSYILDGLEKAEKERQSESVPDLQTVHSPYPGQKRLRSVKPRLLKISFLLLLPVVTAAAALFAYTHKDNVTVSSGSAELPSHHVSTELTEPHIPQHSEREDEQSLSVFSEKDIPPLQSAEDTTQTVPLFDEIAGEIRSAIPPIAYAGHTYAEDPQYRLIIINNKIMREGQRVADDLRLVEITWEGIILDYRGTRFRMITAQN